MKNKNIEELFSEQFQDFRVELTTEEELMFDKIIISNKNRFQNLYYIGAGIFLLGMLTMYMWPIKSEKAPNEIPTVERLHLEKGGKAVQIQEKESKLDKPIIAKSTNSLIKPAKTSNINVQSSKSIVDSMTTEKETEEIDARKMEEEVDFTPIKPMNKKVVITKRETIYQSDTLKNKNK